MSYTLNNSAREACLRRLNDLLDIGCRRWQSASEGWGKHELRPLKIAKFLKEQCDDASYKFWFGLRKSVGNPEATPSGMLALSSFCERLRRSKYFEVDELMKFEEYFREIYWPVEKAWIQDKMNLTHSMEVFAELRRDAPPKPRGKWGMPEYWSWAQDKVWAPYFANNYAEASENCIALFWGHICEPPQQRDVLFLEQFIFSAAILVLNCEGDTLGTMYERGIAQLRSDEAEFFDESTLPQACIAARRLNRLNGASPADFYNSHFQPMDHLDLNSVERKLFASWEITKIRRRFIGKGAMFCDVSPEHRKQVFRGTDQLQLLADPDHSRIVVNDAFREPHQLFRRILAMCRETETYSPEAKHFMRCNAFLGMATCYLEEDLLDLSEAAHWLVNAKDELLGSSHLLSWSDWYSVCADFMEVRGNQAMSWAALEAVRDLQSIAGNDEKAKQFAKKASLRASTPIPARLWELKTTPDESVLIDFLLGETAGLNLR